MFACSYSIFFFLVISDPPDTTSYEISSSSGSLWGDAIADIVIDSLILLCLCALSVVNFAKVKKAKRQAIRNISSGD
jgi:hypothetical protein